MAYNLIVYARKENLPSVLEVEKALAHRAQRLSLGALRSFGESPGFVPVISGSVDSGFELAMGRITDQEIQDFLDDPFDSGAGQDIEFGEILSSSNFRLTFSCKG